jgi:hypothetical protein
MIFVVLLVAQIVMQHGPIILRGNGLVENPIIAVLLVDKSGKPQAPIGMIHYVIIISMPSLNLINEV